LDRPSYDYDKIIFHSWREAGNNSYQKCLEMVVLRQDIRSLRLLLTSVKTNSVTQFYSSGYNRLKNQTFFEYLVMLVVSKESQKYGGRSLHVWDNDFELSREILKILITAFPQFQNKFRIEERGSRKITHENLICIINK
jgi:hypothetical protein